jgi:hypothetical protein
VGAEGRCCSRPESLLAVGGDDDGPLGDAGPSARPFDTDQQKAFVSSFHSLLQVPSGLQHLFAMHRRIIGLSSVLRAPSSRAGSSVALRQAPAITSIRVVTRLFSSTQLRRSELPTQKETSGKPSLAIGLCEKLVDRQVGRVAAAASSPATPSAEDASAEATASEAVAAGGPSLDLSRSPWFAS